MNTSIGTPIATLSSGELSERSAITSDSHTTGVTIITASTVPLVAPQVVDEDRRLPGEPRGDWEKRVKTNHEARLVKQMEKAWADNQVIFSLILQAMKKEKDLFLQGKEVSLPQSSSNDYDKLTEKLAKCGKVGLFS